MPKPLKILQASAGSGKTFSLTAHYLTLLLSSEGKYREILAVTFTNKATEEMKTRILEVLQGFATGAEKVDDYRALVLKEHPDLTPETLKLKADKIYRRILHDYSRFSISTIDGFVQKVIRGFAFELGLNADYNLEMNYDKVKDDLVEKLDESLNHNKQLLQWIIDLAIERISDNKSWNYKSELYNLIGEIFKERFQVFEQAVNQLGADNIDELFKNYIRLTKVEVKTFEEQIAKMAAESYQLFDDFAITSDQLKGKSRNGLLKLQHVAGGDFSKLESVFKFIDQPDDWFAKNFNAPDFFQALNAKLSALQTEYVTKLPTYALALAFNKNLYYLRLMQEIASLLTIYRSENENLLISDAQKLISGITSDAGENPSFIWEKVGNRYRNFLFDEFQDTSVSQWGSFKSLLTNAMASSGGQFIDNLIVGDTKQSIYRWRNGDWNILHRQAKADVGVENVVEDSLGENYRSAANIIQFNNALYASISAKIQKSLNESVDGRSQDVVEWWTENQFDDIITKIYSGATQNLALKTAKGGVIKIKKFVKEDSDAERFTETTFRDVALDDMVQEIRFLKENKAYAQRDIAVLVRSNNDALRVVKKLMEAEIEVISGDALLISNNSCIKLIINTLKAFVGLDAQNALYKANCIALYHFVKGETPEPEVYQNLKNRPLQSLAAILPADLCNNWQHWLQLPLPELVETLIGSYGLKQKTAHIPYLLAFRDLTANAGRFGEKGIVNFLNWWEEEGIKKSLPSPEGTDAIQVITIHKSKGLAFRAVFIPFCDWNLKTRPNSIFWVSAQQTMYKDLVDIPLKYSEHLADSAVAKAYFEETLYSNLDALNEMYVATTRAKDYIYMGLMGKAKPSLSNVGDALALVLDDFTAFAEPVEAEGKVYPSEFAQTNRYEIDEYVEGKKDNAEGNHISLSEFPTTERLSELYVETQERHLKHILNIEQSGRKGSILHDVLANVSNEKEVDSYLLDLLSQGDILEDELPELKTSAMKVLNHPDLTQLLAAATESITEKNIIDAEGKIHRPDRILIHENEIIILDYKFTIEQTDKHIEQILTYKNLLTDMGYNSIKSYLFYALKGELKHV
ncbi:UvrD-helicase domain-containing protein [Pedobacter sp. AW1-32]|uniref:UvrD-helicase domain-containing protein n=1 Tax=Pedobacter sp. AW1-32 TaxID=3383026 RepID=UPI003FEDF0AD